MDDTSPASESLLRQALLNQYNLIVLGGMGLLSLAAASSIPLGAALAGEVVWLAVGARTAGFRRWVAHEARRRDEARWGAVLEAAVAGLEGDAAARARAIGGAVMEVGRLAGDLGQEAALGPGGAKLALLVRAGAGLAGAQQRLARLIGASRADAIEQEIARLGNGLLEEKDPMVRISMRQALALGQRRLKQIEQGETARRALELKMSTLEMSLDYLRARLLGDGVGVDLGAALDEMLAAAQLSPDLEAEAVRSLGAARITSLSGPIVSQVG
jgi:hypothetical protein